MKPIVCRTTVLRKSADLPRYLEFPSRSLAAWDLSGATPVELWIGDTRLGRRNLKRWGQGRDVWFLELPEALCVKAGVDAGDAVEVRLERASEEPPEELADLLRSDPVARERWSGMTEARRRALADHVREAKRPETRVRRALRALETG